jgi:anti-sigma factor RsiW
MPNTDPEIEGQTGEGDAWPHSQRRCGQPEARLVEYLDGVLMEGECRTVKAHLAICPECQALSEQWRQLDSELAHALRRPALSASFGARVWQEIETASVSTLEQRRAQLHAEWATAWSHHRRRFLWTQLPAVLDGLGYGVMVAVAACVALRLSRLVIGMSTQLTTSSVQQWVLPLGLGMAALSLITAAGRAAQRPLRRWLGELFP